MIDISQPFLTNPLEREYESWIVSEIHYYFRKIGIDIEICAVSPSVESSWPSDEVFLYNGKLIGLQFKQTKLAPKTKSSQYTRLHYDLRQPIGQYQLIQKHPEIFYVLPTFINRKWKENALHHCIFWRPDSRLTYYNAWYNNPKAHTNKSYTNIFSHINSLRWGEFIEQILSCEIGKKEDKINLSDYVRSIKAELANGNSNQKSFSNQVEQTINNQGNLDTLYLLHIPFRK